MKWLFDDVSRQVSRMITRSYSTSFSMGIYFIDGRLRSAIYAIYGFVRVADEIVDSFEGYDKRKLLSKYREQTFEAIDDRISVNPVLNSFQQAVHQYQISHELIEIFLRSMEMDLEKITYTSERFQEYILGSAEVVGLMCLHVFTEGDLERYEQLKPAAMKLGAAFQKVNFLRDMKDDYHVLGRVYFPQVDFSDFNNDDKKQIEEEIDRDFDMALEGVRELPPSSRYAVYLAYRNYRTLFNKIRKLSARQILHQRVRISNPRKLGLVINTLVQNKMNLG